MTDRRLVLLALAAVVMAVAAIGASAPSDADGDPATGIELDRSQVTIRAGDDVSLSATVFPSGCTDEVTWSSSSPMKVEVDENGRLTPKAYGTSVITAAVGGFSATCKVTVDYAQISISKSTLKITEGSTGTLSVNIPSGYSDAKWKTSESLIATVSGSGASATVTGVGVGQATITVTCGNLYKATCTVTVTEKPAVINSYTFHLSMDMDYDIANTGTSGLTAEDLEHGITLTAKGYNAGAALESALRSEGIPCSFWSGTQGGNDLLYWVNSIMGLGDVHYPNGDWKYWIQYHYSGGRYVYNDLTLGHFTDGGSFKIVYGITSDPGSHSGTTTSYATVPSAATGLVYNGKQQTGVPSGTGYTISGNKAVDAGSYTATLTLSSGYKWSDGSTGSKRVSWSISKASLTARYSGETIMYGFSPSLKVAVTGFVNGESASTADGYAAPKVRASDLSIGRHTLTPSGGSADNYSFKYYSGVLTVDGSNVIDVPVPKKLTYNGKGQNGVAFSNGYEVSGYRAVDAGDYVAVAVLKDGYYWSDGTTAAKTVNWSISKAVLIARYAGETVMHGFTPSLEVTVSGFVDGESESTAAGYVAPVVSAPDLSVGKHTLMPSGGRADNYSFAYSFGVLTVVPAEVAEGDRFEVSGLVYEAVSLDPCTASLVGFSGTVRDVAVPSAVTYAGKSFSVDSVGDKAFYGCSALSSLDLGSVRTVGTKAFANCSSLKELTVPESVSVVGAYAFYGCGIGSLDIPGDDVVLERSAFSACTGMSSISFSGSGAVIGTNAFYKNNGVSSVDLSTVASVGSKAFSYCYGMRSLVIPGNLSSIGSYAFYKCVGLEELTVEEGVKKILPSAFSGCTSLETVSLPGSLVYIGANAFHGIRFADQDGNPLDPVLKNLRGHVFSGSGKVLGMVALSMDFVQDGISYSLVSPGAVAITGYDGAVSAVPSAVEHDGHSYVVSSIGDSAFLRCSTITSVDLSNVRDLGFKALGSCTGITEIVFGDGLESIGDFALYGLSFYDGGEKIAATPKNLRGHAFAGEGAALHLIS